MARYAVKCLTVPGMPNNEGAVAPIRVTAPEDSILNAQPPYPNRRPSRKPDTWWFPSCFGPSAEAAPGHVQADCGNMNIVTFQGTRPDGHPMSTIYFSTGGFRRARGLRRGRTRSRGRRSMRAVPVEMWESLTGITIIHKRLLPDTSGHGGGAGAVSDRR